MAFSVQDVAIGLAQARREQLVAHEPAVYVDELRVPRSARVGGRPGETVSLSTPFAATERIDCANSGPSAASTRCAGRWARTAPATRPLCLR